ncbi:MAG: cobalamin B12-binding domain-containing protein [Euryarchaeota archaeon]|nr:cobalamin B12-binding domain-containing protein [Euryarchaeota archaeon]
MSSPRVAFYIDYDKFRRDEAPAILLFFQHLREEGHAVDLFTSEEPLLAKAGDYDVAALSVLSTLELRAVLETVARVKEANPGLLVVLGGAGVSGLLTALVRAPGVDVVVEGEGDRTLPVLLEGLRRVKNGRLSREEAEGLRRRTFPRRVRRDGAELLLRIPISGVAVKGGGEVLLASPDIEEAYSANSQSWREAGKGEYPLTPEEFSRLCHPHSTPEEVESTPRGYPWDIVEARGWKSVALYAQRGCNWGRCSYCSISTPTNRRLQVERVLALLREAKARGIERVTFEDDQFLQDTRWVKKLCEGIKAEGLQGLRYGAMVRVDAVRGGLLEELRSAGFARLQIGVESLLPEKVRYLRKTPRGREEAYVARARELVMECAALEMTPGVFIITTRPKEKGALREAVAELRAVAGLMREAYERHKSLPTFNFNDILMAYPGAPLLEEEEYKRLIISRDSYTLEIPYIFEPRSMALANLLGNLMALSRRRGVAPEALNETLEHMEDLVQALEVSAKHLTTPTGLAFELLGSAPQEALDSLGERLEIPGGRVGLVQALAKGRLEPTVLLEAMRSAPLAPIIEKVQGELSEERAAVLALCQEIKRDLDTVEGAIIREVNGHLQERKKRLIEAGSLPREELLRKAAEVQGATEALLARFYPYLKARRTLEALLAWLEKFRASSGRGAPDGKIYTSDRP